VEEQQPAAFAAAMDAVMQQTFDPDALHARAQSFSTAHFEAGFRTILGNTLAASRPC
jgi:hypothetical protein